MNVISPRNNPSTVIVWRLYQQHCLEWPSNLFVSGKTLTSPARLSPSLPHRARTSGSSSMLKPPRAWTWVRLRTSSPLVGRFFCLYALHGGCTCLYLTENLNVPADAWLLHQRHAPQSHMQADTSADMHCHTVQPHIYSQPHMQVGIHLYLLHDACNVSVCASVRVFVLGACLDGTLCYLIGHPHMVGCVFLSSQYHVHCLCLHPWLFVCEHLCDRHWSLNLPVCSSDHKKVLQNMPGIDGRWHRGNIC